MTHGFDNEGKYWIGTGLSRQDLSIDILHTYNEYISTSKIFRVCLCVLVAHVMSPNYGKSYSISAY